MVSIVPRVAEQSTTLSPHHQPPSSAPIIIVVGIVKVVAKLLFWNRFELGLAPILIGFFFISAVQLFFVGILGEYIGSIWTHVRRHPHVFEKERLNF